MPEDCRKSLLLLDLDSAPPLASCGSTQQVAKELALKGAPEGTCVLAVEQTAGRGRGERTWHSPAGMGLWMSFVLRPAADQPTWPALTPLTALSAAAALESLWARDRRGAGPPWTALIKWPNDLYGVRGKLGGILAETAENAVVIGLGLNIGSERDSFPPDLRGRASSLRIEGFSPVPDLRSVAEAFNQGLTQAYERFRRGDLGFLREGLLRRFMLRNRRVQILGAGGQVEGVAVDLGDLGELILETPSGRRSVISGEVVSVGGE